MRVYASLFAYLNNSQPVTEDTILQARDSVSEAKPQALALLRSADRPIISLASADDLTNQPFLISRDEGVYEIPFPYLKPADIAHHNNQLEYVLNLSISNQSHALHVTDEVLDLDTIEEKSELQEWQDRLGERLDNKTALLILLLVGMFTTCFSDKTQKPQLWVIQLQEKLNQFDVAQANQPLVISVERRYQLKRKLEVIATKLRHQLRRQAELMPLGRIQEMDAYCLRDYTRRPGTNAAEKAGSRQELMGIQRHQDYNTPENKFLVYFCNILHLQCYSYQRGGGTQYGEEIQAFQRVIDLFKQQPVVRGIQDRQYKFTKPNYVLQQNPIYRSFYQAYLDYLRKRYEKQRIWAFRNNLFSDTVYICLQAAILGFQGIGVDALARIIGSNAPEQGHYIKDVSGVKLRVFLQNRVYVFGLRKPATGETQCDWLLTVDIHNLASAALKTETLQFPIWVFWYRPTDEALTQADIYLQNSISVPQLENTNPVSLRVKRSGAKQSQPQGDCFASARNDESGTDRNASARNDEIFNVDTMDIKIGIIFYLQVPPSNSSETGKIEHYSDRLWLCQLPEPIAAGGFTSSVELMARLIQSAVELPL